MDSKNLVKFPITYKERQYNLHGTGYVPCEVSERWLKFHETTLDKSLGFIFVDVMTTNAHGEDKKLCSLCVNIYDLKKELDKIISD